MSDKLTEIEELYLAIDNANKKLREMVPKQKEIIAFDGKLENLVSAALDLGGSDNFSSRYQAQETLKDYRRQITNIYSNLVDKHISLKASIKSALQEIGE